tara:strand:- start:476 stop:757 length:282 start_codon:yes stop_codon:yes gene_type:complete
MTMTVATLVMVLAVWMLVCGWCGYRRRVFAFLAVLLAGLALNMAWMVFGLNARPFEANALMAETSALMYAIGAFGVGWLAGRLARQWQSTQVE